MYKSVRKSEHIGIGSLGEVHKVFVKKPDLSEDIMAMKHLPALLDIKDLASTFIKDMKLMTYVLYLFCLLLQYFESSQFVALS